MATRKFKANGWACFEFATSQHRQIYLFTGMGVVNTKKIVKWKVLFAWRTVRFLNQQWNYNFIIADTFCGESLCVNAPFSRHTPTRIVEKGEWAWRENLTIFFIWIRRFRLEYFLENRKRANSDYNVDALGVDYYYFIWCEISNDTSHFFTIPTHSMWSLIIWIVYRQTVQAVDTGILNLTETMEE